ncbi:hypothetical protein OS965_09980 [Streptomyces sp. H27-G5]|uniref:hypothetical protein n=1 Tax=Streptomyces sp. H27-G5 TaxID=2996698 RepID=UPI00226D9D0F|nr:hypothetical protein [Streptomyces sp. H27-G5]MCY0918501.1 hypothetical protein [Streptomyces sp. H27-G5]
MKTTSSRARSQANQRQAAIRVRDFGSCQARSQTLAMARLKLVAEIRAIGRPTTPVVSRRLLPVEEPNTCWSCASAWPVRPNTVRNDARN